MPQKVTNDPGTVESRILVLEDGISTDLPKIRYDMGSQDFVSLSTRGINDCSEYRSRSTGYLTCLPNHLGLLKTVFPLLNFIADFISFYD